MFLVAAGISALLLFLTYNYIIVPVFISSLSNIPLAHFTASFSSLWMRRRRRVGIETRTIFKLHQELGPVVRLGPSEISVNCLDGLRAVYLGGFERHPWYRQFDFYGTPNMFTMMDHKSHTHRKRILANVYSKSYLQGSSDLRSLTNIVLFDRFLPILQANASAGAAVDVLPLFKSLAMDMVSGYVFGSSYSTNFLQDIEQRAWWFRAYDIFKAQCQPKRAGGEVEKWCMKMCEAAELSTVDSEGKAANGKATKPVVYKQLSQGLEQTNTDTTPQTKSLVIASELLDQLIAGHESSGITITYIMYELSRRRSLQKRLRQELLTFSPRLFAHSAANPQAGKKSRQRNADNLPIDNNIIDSLPLLDAIVQETLRLRPAAFGPQPRITPHSLTPICIEGYTIPPGVRVSSNAYTLHRNAKVFPDPGCWIPERWLEAEESQLKEMRRWFWPFGSGGRMCLGNNFAIQNIKNVLAIIYVNFCSQVVDDAGIEQADAYVAGPVGDQLILELELVNASEGAESSRVSRQCTSIEATRSRGYRRGSA